MLQEDFKNKMDKGFELIQNCPEKALTIFEDLLELDSENVDVLNGMGSALMKLDRLDEAEQCFNESVLINETSCAVLNKGLILKYKKEYQSSLKFYDRAVQLDSNLNSIVLILKREIIELIDENIGDYTDFSTETTEYIKTGIDYRDDGHFCDALDCFNQAMNEDESCRPAVSALTEEIKTLLFNEFLFDTPTFKEDNVQEFKIEFFKALLVEENPKEALKFLNIILKINEKDLGTLNFKGCILFLFEEYNEAIDCFDKCLSIDNRYYYALYNKGLVLRIMNNFEESLKCFDDLLEMPKYKDKARRYRLEVLENLN